MATHGEICNDWPRTVMTGGCSLVAFAPDGATGNVDDDDIFRAFSAIFTLVPNVPRFLVESKASL